MNVLQKILRGSIKIQRSMNDAPQALDYFCDRVKPLTISDQRLDEVEFHLGLVLVICPLTNPILTHL